MIGLWRVDLRGQLRQALVGEDLPQDRQMDSALPACRTVSWPVGPLDPFFNANTVEDIAEAERLAALDAAAQ